MLFIYISRDTHDFFPKWFPKTGRRTFANTGARIRLWGQPRWSSPLLVPVNPVDRFVAGTWPFTDDERWKRIFSKPYRFRSKRDTVLVLLRQFDTRWLSVRDDFLNKDATIELLRIYIYIYKSRKSLEFIDCKILPVLKNFIEKSIRRILLIENGT